MLKKRNVLIYGDVTSPDIICEQLRLIDDAKYVVVGVVFDTFNIKTGPNNFKTFSIESINLDFVHRFSIEQFIYNEEITSSQLIKIAHKCNQLHIELRLLPNNKSTIADNILSELLLERKESISDSLVIEDVFINKTILVTGAAGSIESEISRQLSVYQLTQLVLVDQAESALYDLQQELVQNGITNFITLVADVRDEKRMEEIFTTYQPNRVFHAAAYKHVPLMEQSPYEALKINILGTKLVADLSVKCKVEGFVMVSTDKAVNPTNVMGATKRVAEMYIGCLSKQHKATKFTITRFGNVLGSNGSVIPLFKKQIENGGPLTVTHKDITRYFMTIPEACRLVLEAGTMGVGGEIYIFDMGKSVKIFDMAKRMISLSGLKYPDDIDIEITGLRPGEKLFEELLADGENTTKTYHEKILIAKSEEINETFVISKINTLYKQCKTLTNLEIVKNIKELVPEYLSQNSEYENLDV
ncbi:UDP-N-acetylglucosamine 4,6-dehydratase family protein [Polaribacter tangerinus]|uniref:UDP-N-acetylglucosamine 4,6-dehydratase family protein n=1 Tax=Polaribacter tangerinus TaxID=1920034 RepID=UPI003743D0F4